MNSIWYWIILYVVVSSVWIIIEMINAPMMDDDYGVEYREDNEI